jgi:hypothetical protein
VADQLSAKNEHRTLNSERPTSKTEIASLIAIIYQQIRTVAWMIHDI